MDKTNMLLLKIKNTKNFRNQYIHVLCKLNIIISCSISKFYSLWVK